MRKTVNVCGYPDVEVETDDDCIRLTLAGLGSSSTLLDIPEARALRKTLKKAIRKAQQSYNR